MAIYFLIAVIIAALSGMGVGGGGLFALYLKYFSDLTQLEVQGSNLLFFIFASGAALLIHAQRRRIYPLAVGLMIATGILGSLCGSAIAVRIGGEILGKLFGLMMIAAGAWRLYGSLR